MDDGGSIRIVSLNEPTSHTLTDQRSNIIYYSLSDLIASGNCLISVMWLARAICVLYLRITILIKYLWLCSYSGGTSSPRPNWKHNYALCKYTHWGTRKWPVERESGENTCLFANVVNVFTRISIYLACRGVEESSKQLSKSNQHVCRPLRNIYTLVVQRRRRESLRVNRIWVLSTDNQNKSNWFGFFYLCCAATIHGHDSPRNNSISESIHENSVWVMAFPLAGDLAIIANRARSRWSYSPFEMWSTLRTKRRLYCTTGYGTDCF